MLAFFCFVITLIGSLNWLCIGFFQYDFVAGLFGTQSSIFSRFVYIIIGISAIFLTYAVIRYRGRLTIKKNKNQQQVLLNKQPMPENINQNLVNYGTENSNINTPINNNSNDDKKDNKDDKKNDNK